MSLPGSLEPQSIRRITLFIGCLVKLKTLAKKEIIPISSELYYKLRKHLH